MTLRLGKATSSDFGKIITPKTGQLSSQADGYGDEKIAEIMTGEYQGIMEPTYYMERGALMEQEAREAYEFENNVEVSRGGFWTDDNGWFGASPDFLVGEEGIGEIKCLKAKNHVSYLLKQSIQPDYIPQVQGQLFVTGREWCDWYIYHPTMPRETVRIIRDEEYIRKLADALFKFRDDMERKINILKSRGIWQVMCEKQS